MQVSLIVLLVSTSVLVLVLLLLLKTVFDEIKARRKLLKVFTPADMKTLEQERCRDGLMKPSV